MKKVEKEEDKQKKKIYRYLVKSSVRHPILKNKWDNQDRFNDVFYLLLKNDASNSIQMDSI